MRPAASVLLAEDDRITRAILQTWLRRWDFETTEVEDGLQAWEVIQKEDAPSLILLDWGMPGLTGLDLCQKIRARQTRLYPYVLLLTARSSKQDIVEGLEAGADDYLIKPFDAGELQARLRVGCRMLKLQNDLLQREEELQFEASHDRLTGLWNRGAIFGFVERELARARRAQESVGLLLVDVDRFKSINDTHGHQTGDTVLHQVAERLRQGIRSYDWAGRYGGEEFLVVLSNCNAETVITCAERLRLKVAATPVQAAGSELAISVSIGAALCTPGHSDLESEHLLKRADVALYRAKHNGRNRVEVAW
jgi:diguanylate cyclase (GGDEF)-like protein